MGKPQSLRNKFVRTLLLVTGVIGAATLAIVVVTSVQASSQQMASVRRYIEQGISSKGKVLTENHARALRGLTLDNAFLDIRRLVADAVQEDPDVVYGLYVGANLETLAYSKLGTKADDAPADDAIETTPPKDAWRELGLSEAGLMVPQQTIVHAVRFGEELLEVVVPVVSEDGERLGTIRYGLSTARMQDAIARARAEARARLQRSVIWIASLVTFAALLGLLLSRMQAVRITRPVAELTAAAEGLAAGNRAVRVSIASGDELERLGASFNKMVADLDASYRALEAMNRTLEQKVEVRTLELARRNRDMRLVLDNVDRGFVTLSMDGVMALERSRVLDEWFGPCPSSLSFRDYIGSLSRSFGVQFQLGWDQVVEDVLPLELALDQMPKHLVLGGRTWSLRYLPFHRDEKLEGVLLVIAEITARLAREREDAEQGELMQSYKRLMLDRGGFLAFVGDAGRMVEAIVGRRLDGDLVLRQRTLHTLKGNAASMGLSVVAGICHQLEDQIADSGEAGDDGLLALAARWAAIAEHVAGFAGPNGELGQRVVEVPEADYDAALALAEAGPGELLEKMKTWRLEPIARPLRRLGDQARALARRLDRGEINVEVQAGGVRIDAESARPLFAELVHVVRNAVDHGLEPPEQREDAGKPRQGKLWLRAAAAEGSLTVEVADDGRGVDWDAIAAAAAARGLPHATDADLLRALCSDGITTRREATETSGRGVGMAALRQRVEAMGGRLDVRSARGAGTTFVVQLPYGADGVVGVPGSCVGPGFEASSRTRRAQDDDHERPEEQRELDRRQREEADLRRGELRP